MRAHFRCGVGQNNSNASERRNQNVDGPTLMKLSLRDELPEPITERKTIENLKQLQKQSLSHASLATETWKSEHASTRPVDNYRIVSWKHQRVFIWIWHQPLQREVSPKDIVQPINHKTCCNGRAIVGPQSTLPFSIDNNSVISRRVASKSITFKQTPAFSAGSEVQVHTQERIHK